MIPTALDGSRRMIAAQQEDAGRTFDGRQKDDLIGSRRMT